MRFFALACATAVLACARGSDAGPVEVKFDRDVCKGCSMVISDRHFAAQVRGGPRGDVAKFDDVGCAVRWLDAQPFAGDPATRIWVARQSDGVFIDARTARYGAGATTPMGYGFGASDTGDGVDFETMRSRVRAVAERR